ncbi:hypothetical protein EVAR_44824_1 [Eumeta japonica]|uniref:Uncharacterized protein n=1 Tax=Eumeta variegata TaxID=151549 RepID=A0A4C1XBC8_EUMVA|nr:hypothetical protein EVAR_44824_1 [Eumeta japonica]
MGRIPRRYTSALSWKIATGNEIIGCYVRVCAPPAMASAAARSVGAVFNLNLTLCPRRGGRAPCVISAATTLYLYLPRLKGTAV